MASGQAQKFALGSGGLGGAVVLGFVVVAAQPGQPVEARLGLELTEALQGLERQRLPVMGHRRRPFDGAGGAEGVPAAATVRLTPPPAGIVPADHQALGKADRRNYISSPYATASPL